MECFYDIIFIKDYPIIKNLYLKIGRGLNLPLAHTGLKISYVTGNKKIRLALINLTQYHNF